GVAGRGPGVAGRGPGVAGRGPTRLRSPLRSGSGLPGARCPVIVVAKIGTSSVTRAGGDVDEEAVARLCAAVATLRRAGHQVVVVTSGAVTAGVATLAPPGGRPSDARTLQALAAIGQHRLMRVYDDALSSLGLLAGQVLLAPLDFAERRQYLHARSTLTRLLELGVVPVVNENDAIADDEIRFGDNDRLAALVANLLRAGLLVLLTDTAGLFDADPRLDAAASLVAEVVEVDAALEAAAGGPGSAAASGGMASKLAAARMASWSGVRTVIAAASRPGVLEDAVAGRDGVGTVVHPRDRRLPARKLWIAFAIAASGRLLVDAGARRALVERDASLLAAGVTACEGAFGADDAVEIVGPDGEVFAKGLARLPASSAGEWLGRSRAALPPGLDGEVVHRDDLVVLAGA
ncbi:MAG TPA: glutamate 5-kinase, partial [Acidimicrobiales bacterium]|nr:glutamate 5-kinase [Acidimicrobiales bacterium]